jgi:hypothetical protein
VTGAILTFLVYSGDLVNLSQLSEETLAGGTSSLASQASLQNLIFHFVGTLTWVSGAVASIVYGIRLGRNQEPVKKAIGLMFVFLLLEVGPVGGPVLGVFGIVDPVGRTSSADLADPTAVSSATTTSFSACGAWGKPVYREIAYQPPNIVSVFYTFHYASNPENCFRRHPEDPDWFVAGETTILLETPDGHQESWSVYDVPTIRDWDGEAILVGDVIDLSRMPAGFQRSWTSIDQDPSSLTIRMSLLDLADNSTVVDTKVGAAGGGPSEAVPLILIGLPLGAARPALVILGQG